MYLPAFAINDDYIHYVQRRSNVVIDDPITLCGMQASRTHVTYVMSSDKPECVLCLDYWHMSTAHPDDERHHVVATGFPHTLEIRDKHVLTVDVQGTARLDDHYGTGNLTIFAYDTNGCPPVNLDPRGTYKEKMTAVYNATNLAVYVPGRGRLTITDTGDIALDGEPVSTQVSGVLAPHSLPVTPNDPDSARVYVGNGAAYYKSTDDRVLSIAASRTDIGDIEVQASRPTDAKRDIVHPSGSLVVEVDGDYGDGPRYPTVRFGRFNEVSVNHTAGCSVSGSDAVDWLHVTETQVRFGLDGTTYRVTREGGVMLSDGTPFATSCMREHVDGHKASDWRAVTHGNGRLDIHIPGWTITLPDGTNAYSVSYDHALGGLGEALYDALQAKRGYGHK